MTFVTSGCIKSVKARERRNKRKRSFSKKITGQVATVFQSRETKSVQTPSLKRLDVDISFVVLQ